MKYGMAWRGYVLCSLTLIGAVYAILAVLIPSGAKADLKQQIWHTEIAGIDLWIPAPYHSPMVYERKTTDVLLEALYPDFSPIEDSIALWKRGEQYRNIRLLVSMQRTTAPFDDIVATYIKSFDAYSNQGIQYGLTYLTQMPNNPKDRGELWIEKDGERKTSFIECTKISSVPVQQFPQCAHHFISNHMYFKVSYDKKLLPEWKEIQDKSIALFEHFRTAPDDRLDLPPIFRSK